MFPLAVACGLSGLPEEPQHKRLSVPVLARAGHEGTRALAGGMDFPCDFVLAAAFFSAQDPGALLWRDASDLVDDFTDGPTHPEDRARVFRRGMTRFDTEHPQHTAQQYDIAVLDVNLGTGSSLDVAEELIKRDVPFVFATGYGDSVMIPERMKSIPVVRKPYSAEALKSALILVVKP